MGPNWQFGRERWGGGGEERQILGEIPTLHPLLRKTGLLREEAAFLVHTFPWETEFINIALWSPRGAQARERTRIAGTTEPIAQLHFL